MDKEEKNKLFISFQKEFNSLLDKYGYRLLPVLEVNQNGILPAVKIVERKPVERSLVDPAPGATETPTTPAAPTPPTTPPATEPAPAAPTPQSAIDPDKKAVS